MRGDGRELRRESNFGVATVYARQCQDSQAWGPEFSIREGHDLRGLEQNSETASRWAQQAREGKKVMQFLQQRRYIAVVVDGKVQFYGSVPEAGFTSLRTKDRAL